MRPWPEALWARLVVVLLAATGAVFVLDLAVRAHDAKVAADDVPAPPYEPEPFEQVNLPRVDGTVRLVLRPESVPDDAACVVQVLAGGDFAMRRPLPLPAGPEASANISPVVVLPALPSRLDASARATLADVIGALVAERPVPVDRFLTLDFRMAVPELERLLVWVR